MEFKGKYSVEIRKSLTHPGDELVLTMTDGSKPNTLKVTTTKFSGPSDVPECFGYLFQALFPTYRDEWREQRIKEIELQNGL